MLKLSAIRRTILSSVTLSLLLAVGSGCKDSSQSQGWAGSRTCLSARSLRDLTPSRNGGTSRLMTGWRGKKPPSRRKYGNSGTNSSRRKTPKIREKLQSKLIADEVALSVIHRRQTEGDYIKFKTPADIPQDLKWEDGLDNPEIGDPNAKKAACCANGLRGPTRHIPAQRPEQQQRFPRPPV